MTWKPETARYSSAHRSPQVGACRDGLLQESTFELVSNSDRVLDLHLPVDLEPDTSWNSIQDPSQCKQAAPGAARAHNTCLLHQRRGAWYVRSAVSDHE